MAAFEKRIKEWTPSQLAQEGYALFGLVAKPDGYLFRERIFRFANPIGDGLLPSQHQFTQVGGCEQSILAMQTLLYVGFIVVPNGLRI